MIDIHAHILPGIDDGSDSLDTTLEMLEMAADSGVTEIIATPHCNIPGMYRNYADERLEKLWNRVQDAKNRLQIPIKIHKGMEIYATEKLPDLLRTGQVWTLAGTKYFLTEFSFDEDPLFCRKILKQCAEFGYKPIIAHPERYYFVQEDPNIAYEWCTTGFGLQINKGSILGRFGKREQELGLSLIDHGLAACVASDAHAVNYRTTYMAETKVLLINEFGAEYTKLLTEENPRRILMGSELLGMIPERYEFK